MGLFRKSEPKVVLPEEVSQYYADQRRERRGAAIFMGLTALILTLLIGFGLFWGGRWAYNTFVKKDNSNTAQNQGGNTGFDTPSLSGNGGNSNNVAGGNSGSNSNSQSGDSSANAPGVNSTSGNQSTTASDGSVAGSQTTGSIPYTGDEPASLPRTGDEGH